ncbi:MAG: glycosyltransferase [Chitinivibrionales bacterium]|nr:glycosyltransferase [Chitinivibrionales bacterium]
MNRRIKHTSPSAAPEFYFVNKFHWPTETPMVYVSTMSTYALAQAGCTMTLIGSGDPQHDIDRELRKSFSLRPLPHYTIKLFSKMRINRRKKLTLLFYARAAWYILTSSRSQPVIISRNTTFLAWLWLLKFLTGAKALFETHGYHGKKTLPDLPARGKRKFGNVSFYYMVLERIILNRLDGVICITHPQQDIYRADFVRVPSIVLPVGAPLSPDEKIDTHQAFDRRCVVFIGRDTSNADGEVLLKACSLCKPDGIRFAWIGLNDAARAKLEIELERKAIADHFILQSWMTPRQLREYIISNASAGIAAYKPGYRSEVVTSPTKIFDYFALGLPVVAAKMPTTTSIMSDGNEGVFYHPGDPQSLASAIRKVLAAKSPYKSMSAQALCAAEHYSYASRARRLISFAGGL